MGYDDVVDEDDARSTTTVAELLAADDADPATPDAREPIMLYPLDDAPEDEGPFDRGGWLQSGSAVKANRTGQPEPLRPSPDPEDGADGG